jgi:hypothetical protein
VAHNNVNAPLLLKQNMAYLNQVLAFGLGNQRLKFRGSKGVDKARVVSETGLVYTFTTPKLQPLVTKAEGKNLIQVSHLTSGWVGSVEACLSVCVSGWLKEYY